MGVSSFTKPRLPGLFSSRFSWLDFLGSRRSARVRSGPLRAIKESAIERRALRLRPTRQRRRSLRGQRVRAAFDAQEPAVDVAQQNLRRIRDCNFDVPGAPGPARQRSRAGECLLAVRGHDRRLTASAEHGIAETPPMLVDEPRSALAIAARAPRDGLDQQLDAAARRHAEQAEPQQPAKFAHARIALAPAAARGAHGKPDFIARRAAIDSLQHELEIERELQLADNNERRLLAADRDEIATADFALDVETERLEEPFHRDVERSFLPRRLVTLRWLIWHGCVCRARSRAVDLRSLPATMGLSSSGLG